jgi:hypothetical protein
MTALEYLKYFEEVINEKITSAPYDNPDFLHYAKLNHSRQNRWFKTGELHEELVEALTSICEKQEWILITEPWCGDAAHSVPFIIRIAEKNPLIELTIQLRDEANSLIDSYLTNGNKSIPKLIVRDVEGNDLFTWGPRPNSCHELYVEHKEQGADFETLKTELQKWYNENKGMDLQKEIQSLILDR